jgi:exodeoxyribonuclease VII small subunit
LFSKKRARQIEGLGTKPLNACTQPPNKLPFAPCKKNGARAVTKKANKLPDLEESLAEITQLIDKMEHGEQTLEQSLTHFERGITLVKHCQQVLEKADQKVQLLIKKNNQDTLIAYTDTDDEENHDD